VSLLTPEAGQFPFRAASQAARRVDASAPPTGRQFADASARGKIGRVAHPAIARLQSNETAVAQVLQFGCVTR
jgi:hypothetical protein